MSLVLGIVIGTAVCLGGIVGCAVAAQEIADWGGIVMAGGAAFFFIAGMVASWIIGIAIGLFFATVIEGLRA